MSAALAMCPRCGVPVFAWANDPQHCVSCGHALGEKNTGSPEQDADADIESMKWYREAAGLGNTDAMLRMGWLHEMGQGVPQDHGEAAKWYRKAALTGCPIGQSRLGSLYFLGHGVTRDCAKAAKWYRKAAEQGDPDGEWLLGLLYLGGQGVPQDYVEAHFWLTLACTGHPSIADHIKSIVSLRDEVAGKLTQEESDAVRERVNQWKPAHTKSFLIERRARLFDTVRHWFHRD